MVLSWRRVILISSFLGLIVLVVEVGMWRTSRKASELAAVLKLSDKRALADARVAVSQPDPDYLPTGYFAILANGSEGFTRLAEALATKSATGPMFSSPLDWKLPPGVQLDSWDESYPDVNTPIFYAQRGNWTVWAKLQSGRTFLVATKTDRG
jgi:hypothetical protein